MLNRESEAARADQTTRATPEVTLKPHPSADNSRQREAWRGSSSEHDPNRPPWTNATRIVAEYDYRRADGTYAFTVFKGEPKTFLHGRRFVGGYGALDLARRDDPDAFYNFPGLDSVMKRTGDEPDVLYRLPELIADMAARPDDLVFF